ncbi:hypothetical protein GGS23DRAFT_510784 [Durotheca rogersii]|uniref:uncharacterized protein n=1 Tax=Durotheca rogersii TaxID=419775 RepID=UPI0022211B32|nr:uncharacterized protein GGS23DRAFT_510784 [Durotheca rogersii]KAI5863694.1 hypothetical protein GGS23DRAFT_510784 [Durotheca rogersii]
MEPASRISLLPEVGDKFPLQSEGITRPVPVVLFSFNHPRDTISLASSPEALENEQRRVLSKSGGPGDNQEGGPVDSSPAGDHLRVLVVPGHIPHGPDVPSCPPTFKFAKYVTGTERPAFFFEDLCRVAMLQEKLEDLRGTHIVTDTESLWALFSVLHDIDSYLGTKVAKRDYGLRLLLHTESGVTFMKVFNTYTTNGIAVESATQFVKENALEWCPSINNHELPTLNPPTSYKQVVTYTMGGLRLVVQDGDRICSTEHACEPLGEDYLYRDGHD